MVTKNGSQCFSPISPHTPSNAAERERVERGGGKFYRTKVDGNSVCGIFDKKFIGREKVFPGRIAVLG